MDAFRLERDEIEAYLKELTRSEVHILAIQDLRGEALGSAALKQFGYGRPMMVAFVSQGREEKVVFHCIQRNAFGREREDDCVAAVWLDFNTFNRLPGHVHAVDKVIHNEDGKLQSIASADAILLVTAYRPGQIYAEDLIRRLYSARKGNGRWKLTPNYAVNCWFFSKTRSQNIRCTDHV